MVAQLLVPPTAKSVKRGSNVRDLTALVCWFFILSSLLPVHLPLTIFNIASFLCPFMHFASRFWFYLNILLVWLHYCFPFQTLTNVQLKGLSCVLRKEWDATIRSAPIPANVKRATRRRITNASRQVQIFAICHSLNFSMTSLSPDIERFPFSEPKKSTSKKSTSKTSKSKKSKSVHNFAMDNLQYFSALIGFGVLGVVLRKHLAAQVIAICAFWTYIYWFCSRFDGIKQSDLSWQKLSLLLL